MTREQRRTAMPEVTAFLDDIRRHCGDPAFISASENGHEIVWGHPTDPDRSAAIQPGER